MTTVMPVIGEQDMLFSNHRHAGGWSTLFPILDYSKSSGRTMHETCVLRHKYACVQSTVVSAVREQWSSPVI
jgi:hypothetical protein